MKKAIKAIAIIAIAMFMLTGIMCFGCSGLNYRIKTKYGDIFLGHSDSWGESAYLSCPEHNFNISITFLSSKSEMITHTSILIS